MNNGWKALLGAGALAAVDVGIAEYFFQRTMVRQNAKVERTKEMSGTRLGAVYAEDRKMERMDA